jgi:ABC-type multidrug transport system fused ATPase/permease subunit
MRTHHRNMRFRPPRRDTRGGPGAFALYLDFFKRYLLPYRNALLFCAFWWTANAGTPYLMAWYSRVVVDSILRIEPAAESGGREARAPSKSVAPSRPRLGFNRRMDRGGVLPVPVPGAAGHLALLFLAYSGTVVVQNLLTRIEARVRIRLGQRLTGRLREDLHEKILKLSLSYHRAHAPGRLMARILSDVGEVQDQMIVTLLQLLGIGTSIATGFCILLLIDWRMAAIVGVTIPAYMGLIRWTRVRRQEVNAELRHTNSWLYSLVTQKLDAIRAIQAYGREPHERLNFHRLSACYLRDSMLQQHIGAGLGGLSGLVSAFGTGAVFLFGVREVLEGRMTLGSAMFAYGTASVLFAPFHQLAGYNMTLSKLLIILQRLRQVMDEPVEIEDAPDAVDFPCPLRDGISLDHAHFRYPKTAEPVIEDLHLRIPAGSWLCVMGPSGSGKTTLLYLLSRLLSLGGGSILYDQADLNRIRMATLRKRIALVPQEPQIFSGSVRENICYGFPDATPRQIIQAAQAAEIHDSIMNLPVRYETLLGEKGVNLSGGQRQRLSLARALLADPEVLLLDDCTSALDTETEQKIQGTLARVLRGRTAVIVSQRASMARRCQLICVLNNGVVEELGTHEELAGKNGFYGRLVRQQTEAEASSQKLGVVSPPSK